MDAFTVLFFLFFLGIFLAAWKSYFFPGGSLRSRPIAAMVSCAILAACGVGIGFVLLRWSVSDVRDHPGELLFYFAVSLLWVA